jgi:hypothetical protein
VVTSLGVVTQTILSARIGAARILSTLHVPIEKLLLDGDDHRSVTTSRHVPFHGFDPHGEVVIARRRLPHWRQIGVAYFITFRLADSVPQPLLRQWRDERTIWLRWHPPPWRASTTQYEKAIHRPRKEWLDVSHAALDVRSRELLSTTIRRKRYDIEHLLGKPRSR